MNPVYITFGFYLVLLIVIGIITYRMTNSMSDYVLGGRKLNSWVTAFSAQASDFSGWLLLGLPGVAYASSMSEWSLFIAIGLAVGAAINWHYVAKRLRNYTYFANDSITISEFFENRFRDKSHLLRVVSAVFIVIFFMFYTASGLVAGGKLFETTFGFDYTLALSIGALIIFGYTFLGGFIAVSWTDFIQGFLMFLALLVTPIIAIQQLGGFGEVLSALGQVNPSLLSVGEAVEYDFANDVFWETSGTVTIVAVISALAWGLGYFGQPHILTRFMAIKSVAHIPKARLIAIICGLVVPLYGAIMVGTVGIAYFGPDNPLNDPEQVFIQMVQVVFNPWVAGILLAAVLSAIMSTIDSQLLVSSSALIEDFYRVFIRKQASQKELVWASRTAVFIILLIAFILAFNESNTVLELVSYAWAGFGAAFGPAILFSLFWKRTTMASVLVSIIAGGLTVLLWGYTGSDLYEIVPGFALASLSIVIISLISKGPSQEIMDEFDHVRHM
ncbi:sodium/proline symporter PutP [Alteribacillus bidgolensis]|uniref:Sodium/proline symporter n=1 Tax=Alteribacillus bidgolensis TaxID=930129 RepID=A0A1G8HMA1_9BACI|nr:sodium/proline symporter PutP [Alteribacillus bidgolensis]SDI07570.1 sodium/proline symporter [Alteribacillus bidgolensis]